jgi:hypothetical protein
MSNLNPAQTIRNDRELTRDLMARNAAKADPKWSTYDPALPRDHAKWVLRWIDCAPASAQFLIAPLMDKRGTPCGDVYSENIGPCKNFREARAKHGLNPITGKAV